jgi:hypothetical protein
MFWNMSRYTKHAEVLHAYSAWLRIHDILLWAELSGGRQRRQDLGRPFLG